MHKRRLVKQVSIWILEVHLQILLQQGICLEKGLAALAGLVKVDQLQ